MHLFKSLEKKCCFFFISPCYRSGLSVLVSVHSDIIDKQPSPYMMLCLNNNNMVMSCHSWSSGPWRHFRNLEIQNYAHHQTHQFLSVNCCTKHISSGNPAVNEAGTSNSLRHLRPLTHSKKAHAQRTATHFTHTSLCFTFYVAVRAWTKTEHVTAFGLTPSYTHLHSLQLSATVKRSWINFCFSDITGCVSVVITFVDNGT